MSKRITLSAREIQHIIQALQRLQTEPALKYQVTLAGIQAYQDIINRLTQEQV